MPRCAGQHFERGCRVAPQSQFPILASSREAARSCRLGPMPYPEGSGGRGSLGVVLADERSQLSPVPVRVPGSMNTPGVISHGLLREEAVALLQGVDHIVHAGDIGTPTLRLVEVLFLGAAAWLWQGSGSPPSWRAKPARHGHAGIQAIASLCEDRPGNRVPPRQTPSTCPLAEPRSASRQTARGRPARTDCCWRNPDCGRCW
jgi:hypothetical protein